MGTSNWQNIPFCIEVLMKIAPQRALDIGVGYGRWGMILREFCDVWYGKVSKNQWSIHIEGIEGYKDNISSYHNAFYNEIHIGDARNIIPTLDGQTWDVIIYGDVLEHFERKTGEYLLDWSINHSKYVLVNIPLGTNWPQDKLYDNPYEIHLSTWEKEDFSRYALRRHALFLDYIGRPFGSFLLSKDDPNNLSDSLFSAYTKNLIGEQDSNSFSESGQLFFKALQIQNDQLVKEIETLRNSRSYRIIERIKRLPLLSSALLKLGQMVLPDKSNRANLVDQASTAPDVIISDITSRSELSKPGSSNKVQQDKFNWTESEGLWIEEQRKNTLPLSINHPEWRGILSSAKELFNNIYLLPDDLDEDRAKRYAILFKEAKISSITFQGFPLNYFHLVKALSKYSSNIPISVIWHGNFLHTKEDYAWESWKLLNSLYDEGDIQKIGFVKKGMAEIFRARGMNAHFIMNRVRRIPERPSPIVSSNQQIGIWAEPDWGWKKLPYSMIASLKLIPDSIGNIYNVSPRAEEFGKQLSVVGEYYHEPLTHDKTIEKLGQMHLNMYVSLTECAPMLPLESLSVGVPCLFGPTSHYFQDNEWLYSRLIVPSPDDAFTIALWARKALEERPEIIAQYKQYAVEYNQRAQEALDKFLELPGG